MKIKITKRSNDDNAWFQNCVGEEFEVLCGPITGNYLNGYVNVRINPTWHDNMFDDGWVSKECYEIVNE
jgi:hypothetical protein